MWTNGTQTTLVTKREEIQWVTHQRFSLQYLFKKTAISRPVIPALESVPSLPIIKVKFYLSSSKTMWMDPRRRRAKAIGCCVFKKTNHHHLHVLLQSFNNVKWSRKAIKGCEPVTFWCSSTHDNSIPAVWLILVNCKKKSKEQSFCSSFVPQLLRRVHYIYNQHLNYEALRNRKLAAEMCEV